MYSIKMVLLLYLCCLITTALSLLPAPSYQPILQFKDYNKRIRQNIEAKKRINLVANDLLRLKQIKLALKKNNPSINTDRITVNSLKSALDDVNRKISQGVPGIAHLPHINLENFAHILKTRNYDDKNNSIKRQQIPQENTNEDCSDNKTETFTPDVKLFEEKMDNFEQNIESFAQNIETFVENLENHDFTAKKGSSLNGVGILLSNLNPGAIMPQLNKSMPDLKNTVSNIASEFLDPEGVKNMISKVKNIIPQGKRRLKSSRSLKAKRRQAENNFDTEWTKYGVPIDLKIVGYLQLPALPN